MLLDTTFSDEHLVVNLAAVLLEKQTSNGLVRRGGVSGGRARSPHHQFPA